MAMIVHVVTERWEQGLCAYLSTNCDGLEQQVISRMCSWIRAKVEIVEVVSHILMGIRFPREWLLELGP